MNGITRVLVVDDSAYVRKVIKEILNRSPTLEVVGVARDGEEALELCRQLQPDVVTLDLIMPNLDGLGFIERQMAIRPIPIVVVSIASETGAMALKALDMGAVDFIQKPTALATDKVYEIGHDLIEKVRNAAGIPMARIQPLVQAPQKLPEAAPVLTPKPRLDIVVMGISTGGPQGLKMVIPRFPSDFPVPIAVVLHMPVGYTELYAKNLDAISRLHVVEAQEGMKVEPGMVYLAQAGRHLVFRKEADGTVYTHLDAKPFDTPHRPSVDVLFRSAADVYRSRVLGVVMTGMGQDGLQGCAWIKAQGGMVITEAEETCVVYGMPRSVDEAGLSDRNVPLHGMTEAVIGFV